MKFSAIKCATIVAMTAVTLTAFGAVAQQINPQLKVSPGVQAVKPNDTTLPERVNALQGQVNQLKADVAQLKAEIAKLKSDLAIVTKTAADANFKATLAVNWIDNTGKKLVEEFSKHTHAYVGSEVTFEPGTIEKFPMFKDMHMKDVQRKTGTPQK